MSRLRPFFAGLLVCIGLVQTAVADIRITFERPSLVLSPADTLGFQVEIDSLDVVSGSRVGALATLRSIENDRELWRQKRDARVGEELTAVQLEAFRVVVPQAPGIYRLELEISRLSRFTRTKAESLAQARYDIVIVDSQSEVPATTSRPKRPRLLVACQDGPRLKRECGLEIRDGELDVDWPTLYRNVDDWGQRLGKLGYNAVAIPTSMAGCRLDMVALPTQATNVRSNASYDLLDFFMRKLESQGFKTFLFVELDDGEKRVVARDKVLSEFGVWVTEMSREYVFAARFNEKRHRLTLPAARTIKQLAHKYAGQTGIAGIVVVTAFDTKSDLSSAPATLDDMRIRGALPITNLLQDPRGVSDLIIGYDAVAVFDLGDTTVSSAAAHIKTVSNVLLALPAERLANVVPVSPKKGAPWVKVRQATKANESYFYMGNRSPWPASIHLQLEAMPENIISSKGVLPSRQTDERGNWVVTLAPQEVIACSCRTNKKPVIRWGTTNAEPIERTLADLLDEYRAELETLADRPPLQLVENGSFEAGADGHLPGWEGSQDGGRVVKRDLTIFQHGQASLHLKSEGIVDWAGPSVVVQSRSFEVPPSARFIVGGWVRTTSGDAQPSVRLIVEGTAGRTSFERHLELGATGQSNSELTEPWRNVGVLVDGLPADVPAEAVVRVELTGGGEVWLDNLQVLDLVLLNEEYAELMAALDGAKSDLAAGRLTEVKKFIETGFRQQLSAFGTPSRLVPSIDRPLAVSWQLASVPASDRTNHHRGPNVKLGSISTMRLGNGQQQSNLVSANEMVTDEPPPDEVLRKRLLDAKRKSFKLDPITSSVPPDRPHHLVDDNSRWRLPKLSWPEFRKLPQTTLAQSGANTFGQGTKMRPGQPRGTIEAADSPNGTTADLADKPSDVLGGDTDKTPAFWKSIFARRQQTKESTLY